jgi:hypothetical protein
MLTSQLSRLDVRMNTPVTPEKQAVQAEAYARVVRSCMAVEKCEGITIWVGRFFYLLLNDCD